jgi:hypothetical protein
MFILNTSIQDLTFEGTVLLAGKVTETDEIKGQRLLALYWHNPLELVEQSESEKEDSIIEKVISSPVEGSIKEMEDSVIVKTNEEIQEENSFFCPECKKTFKNNFGLSNHMRLSKAHKK